MPEHLPIQSGNSVFSTDYPRLPDLYVPEEVPGGADGLLVTNGFVQLRCSEIAANNGGEELEPVQLVMSREWPDVAPQRQPDKYFLPTTVVCATTPHLVLEEGDEALPLNDACVERILREAALLVDAYSYMKNDFKQAAISRYTVHMFVFARILNGDGTAGEIFIHQLPGALPHGRPTLTQPEMGTLLAWRTNLRQKHPFAQFIRFTTSARRSLYYYGDPATAVVQAQTAAEVLLNGVLRLSLIEEGKTEAEVRSVMGSRFKTRVSRDLARVLEGDWSLDGTGPVATWWQDTYMLRNRVVHEGTDATPEEARAAFRGGKQLETFVDERLAARIDRYRVAAVLKFGDPGLRRRGLLDDSLQEAIERFMALPFPWWQHLRES